MSEWRRIAGTNYEISAVGQVRRIETGHIVATWTIPTGYILVRLWVNGKGCGRYVNRLLCEAFHGPPSDPKLQAAHRDGIKANNTPENVQWLTKSENEADKKIHGTSNDGARNGMSKLNVEQVAEIRRIATALPRSSGGRRIKKGALGAVAKRYGVTAGCLRQLISGSRWRQL